EAITKAAQIDRDRVEVVPDPGPLLRRRPPTSDVIAAGQLGFVQPWWVAEQLGAPEDAYGPGVEQRQDGTPDMTPDDDGDTPPEPVGPGQQRQITAEPSQPRTAATPPTIDAARLADIDEQAYTSLEDLIMDIAERALEKLGAKVRSM